MNGTEQPLTVSLLQTRAETVRAANDKRWTLWIFHDIMLWRITGAWPTPAARVHIQEIWEIFLALRHRFQRVYLLIDTDEFASQSYEFRDLLVTDWSHVLDRDDLIVCLAASDPMRRALRNTMAILAGRLDKFRFHKSADAALRYIESQRRSASPVSTPAEPGIADLVDQPARYHGRMAEEHQQDMLECETVPDFELRFRELFLQFPAPVFYLDTPVRRARSA